MRLKLFLFSAIVLSLGCTNNQEKETIYFQGTFDDAIKLANQENKLVFLDFYTVWCGGCKSYDRFVFSDSIVQEYVKANYVFIRVDAEKDEGVELKDRFEVVAYPTLIIADKKGDEIGRIVGFELVFMDSTKFFIEKVENVANSIGTLRALEQEYQQDTSNIGVIYELIEAYQEYGKYQEIEVLASNMMLSEDTLAQKDGQFYFAMSWIDRKQNANPEKMKRFLAFNISPEDDLYPLVQYYLLKFYKDREITDSIVYYYEEMLKYDPEDWYQKKEYAKFLFENNIYIERAKDLAIEYHNLPYPYTEDYKQQLLLAYVKAYEGNIENSMDHFDDWMVEFTSKYSIDDTYWAHHYYADFANRFNVNLNQALAYITIAEEHGGRLTDMILKGEILYKLNNSSEAGKIMNEALNKVSNESQYEQITKLIAYYE